MISIALHRGLIISNWKAQTHHDPKNTGEIWGAFVMIMWDRTAASLPFQVGI